MNKIFQSRSLLLAFVNKYSEVMSGQKYKILGLNEKAKLSC